MRFLSVLLIFLARPPLSSAIDCYTRGITESGEPIDPVMFPNLRTSWEAVRCEPHISHCMKVSAVDKTLGPTTSWGCSVICTKTGCEDLKHGDYSCCCKGNYCNDKNFMTSDEARGQMESGEEFMKRLEALKAGKLSGNGRKKSEKYKKSGALEYPSSPAAAPFIMPLAAVTTLISVLV